jgi:hypothetical protein
MFRSVVDHMAPGAQRSEVAPSRSAERRVVVEVSGSEIDGSASHADRIERNERGWLSEPPTGTVAPGTNLGVPPHPCRASELRDATAMRSLAVLATPARTLEADDPADLGPIDRI